MITVRALEWTAGFLEGEGSFGLTHGTACVLIQADQVQREPLARLRRLYGGTLILRAPSTSRPHAQPIWKWALSGVGAAGLSMTLWPLLSSRRRQQIGAALVAWRARPARLLWICKRGHDLRVTRRRHKRARGRSTFYCRACANIRSQSSRLRLAHL